MTIDPARTTDPDRFAGQCWSRLSEHLLKRFPTLALAERACEALAGPFAAGKIPRAEMRAGTDVAKARECAEIAYAYQPNPSSGDDPAAWSSAWVDLMCDRVRELKETPRWKYLFTILTHALLVHRTLERDDFAAILSAADAQYRATLPDV